jgi:hypothetical protein
MLLSTYQIPCIVLCCVVLCCVMVTLIVLIIIILLLFVASNSIRFEDYVYEPDPVMTMPPTATPKDGEGESQSPPLALHCTALPCGLIDLLTH